MTPHLKAYLKFNGYDDPDEVVCEITGRPAYIGGVDISHNSPRGMGGSKLKDTADNLMALDRRLHDYLESHPQMRWWFQLVHYSFMVTKKVYLELPDSRNDVIFAEVMDAIGALQE